MSSYSVIVLADSVSPAGIRLTTFQLTYPRFIHAEFMTHRALSRNASSSRAIPTARLRQAVADHPAMPVRWGANQPGMQARADIAPELWPEAERLWLKGRDCMLEISADLHKLGVHKQIANRVLEPFTFITVVTSATEWANFFALRCHPDAQPEIQTLAMLMWQAYAASQPRALSVGQWHLPYVDPDNQQNLGDAIGVSVARCARVSYKTYEGNASDIGADLQLHTKLLGAHPLHASPAEHQATPDFKTQHGEWAHPAEHGNFVGWCQYRKTLAGECIKEFVPLVCVN